MAVDRTNQLDLFAALPAEQAEPYRPAGWTPAYPELFERYRKMHREGLERVLGGAIK